MLVAISGHALQLDAGDWLVEDGWHDAAVQEQHGIYLRRGGAQLHVRSFNVLEDLTPKGLLAHLREQKWASRPFEEKTFTVGTLTVVAGTFATHRENELVREFFVTDGRRVANAALTGTRDALADSLASAERVVASIRFV